MATVESTHEVAEATKARGLEPAPPSQLPWPAPEERAGDDIRLEGPKQVMPDGR